VRFVKLERFWQITL